MPLRSKHILTIAFVWREAGVKSLKLGWRLFCTVLVQSLVVGKGVGSQELLKKKQRIVHDGDCHPGSTQEVLHDTNMHYFILEVFLKDHI